MREVKQERGVNETRAVQKKKNETARRGWIGTFVGPGDKQVLRLENVHLLYHHGFVKHLHRGSGLRLCNTTRIQNERI